MQPDSYHNIEIGGDAGPAFLRQNFSVAVLRRPVQRLLMSADVYCQDGNQVSLSFRRQLRE